MMVHPQRTIIKTVKWTCFAIGIYMISTLLFHSDHTPSNNKQYRSSGAVMTTVGRSVIERHAVPGWGHMMPAKGQVTKTDVNISNREIGNTGASSTVNKVPLGNKALGDQGQDITFCSQKVEHTAVVDQQKFLNLPWKGKHQYFFSAFYDYSNHEVQLITDVAVLDATSQVFCMLLFSELKRAVAVKSTRFWAIAGSKVANSSYWRTNRHYSCKLPETLQGNLVPYAVRVGFVSCSSHTVTLRVLHHPPGNKSEEIQFGVCVAPFSKNFSKPNELKEFIEGNRIFGAQKFIFYNYSASSDLNPVLESYVRDGIADVIQWKLYPGAEQSIAYYGQLASMHDCVYRYRNKIKYFALIDLDEVLVSRSSTFRTWNDLVTYNSRPNVGQSPPSLWMFRCAFFKTDWPPAGPLANDTRVWGAGARMPYTLWRERKIWAAGKRSKYIIEGSKMRKLEGHTAQIQPGGRVEILPVDVGLLHHYRDWSSDVRQSQEKLYKQTNDTKYLWKPPSQEEMEMVAFVDPFMVSFSQQLVIAMEERAAKVDQIVHV